MIDVIVKQVRLVIHGSKDLLRSGVVSHDA
jgi:hypothetical protein